MTPVRARLLPLGLLVASGFAFFASRKLEIWTEDGPGPGLMPKIALGCVLVLALAVTLMPGEAPANEEPKDGVGRTFWIYALGCAVMAGAVPFLGFILPAVAVVFVILRFAEDRSWFAASAYALALVGTIVLLFGTALKVQFPDGPAERGLKTLRVL